MGKNQAYKAMQRSRVGSTSGQPDEVEDGMVDGSFHTPEWHAARLASLKVSQTITWEEYKKKQKDEEMKKGELEADTDKLMREYRAQLDSERASKLSRGRNYSSSDKSRKDKKDRDSKKKRSKKRKYYSSSSESSSSSSSSDEDESRRSRSSSRRSKKDKEKRHKSSSREKHSSSRRKDETDGPVPLSKFFGNLKN